MTTDEVRAEWENLGRQYRSLVADDRESSTFLREIGLKPTVLKLLGNCSSSAVLDVGIGSGWLFEALRVGEAHGCDIAEPDRLPPDVNFKLADAASLPWPDEYFDVITSNIALCYSDDIDSPLREMARVSKVGGRLVISLVHPYFYRTGKVCEDGNFLLEKDLSQPFSFEIKIGNRVGPFHYYYRPYVHYINSIIGAGWRLVEVLDWFIDNERYMAAFPEHDSANRSPHVPLFTFFSCYKAD